MDGLGTAAEVHEEITREIDQWLQVLLSAPTQDGDVDLRAVQIMVRSGIHRAG